MRHFYGVGKSGGTHRSSLSRHFEPRNRAKRASFEQFLWESSHTFWGLQGIGAPAAISAHCVATRWETTTRTRTGAQATGKGQNGVGRGPYSRHAQLFSQARWGPGRVRKRA